uniref:Uncharacterized protein n=1 Tax=Rhizophora mucronata TaxID=61149 RepID=A0A2P2Q8X9_RHIMU
MSATIMHLTTLQSKKKPNRFLVRGRACLHVHSIEFKFIGYLHHKRLPPMVYSFIGRHLNLKATMKLPTVCF